MFHPVGSQPPSVYWRRRLLLIGSMALLLVLLVLTAKTLTSSGGGKPAGAGGATTPAQSTSAGSTSRSHTSHPPSSHTSHPPSTHTSSAPASTVSSSVAPPACQAKDLAVAAVSGKSTYHVNDQPVLELQVTNNGAAPCVQDLADKQVELRVYNGESRVWGSHDCQVQPGTTERVLAVHTPVRVAVTWSGLTSQPHCAGTRQRVGAGTYTLYALLSGRTGQATQFTIS
jgi:cytoskeletal protein RodZ